MSNAINVTLNNPSPEAIRELVRSLDQVQQKDTVSASSPLAFNYASLRPYQKEAARVARVVNNTLTKKYAYVFDIDGVLADDKHRLHYIDGTDANRCKNCNHMEDDHTGTSVSPRGTKRLCFKTMGLAVCPCMKFVPKFSRNWKGYYGHMSEDTPIQQNISLLRTLAKENKIILITGRPETYQGVTEQWLLDYDIPWDSIYMRFENNFKKNAEMKKELFDRYVMSSTVLGVFEDNPDAVKMYRETFGLNVFQIESGFKNLEES